MNNTEFPPDQNERQRKAKRADIWGGRFLLAAGVTLVGSIVLASTRWFAPVMTLLFLFVCAWFIAEGLEAFWLKRMPTILGEMKGKVAQVYGLLVIGFAVALGIFILFGALVS